MISKGKHEKNVIEKEGKWWSPGVQEARRARIQELRLGGIHWPPVLSTPFCGSRTGSHVDHRWSFSHWGRTRRSHYIGSHLWLPCSLFERRSSFYKETWLFRRKAKDELRREGVNTANLQSHDGNNQIFCSAMEEHDLWSQSRGSNEVKGAWG